MTTKPYLLLNSIPRCGNTFLLYAFEEAINLNYPGGLGEFKKNFNLVSHGHQPVLLKIPKSDKKVVQFTTFRDPNEQVPSLFGLGNYRKSILLPYRIDKKNLHKNILMAINEYRSWTSLYIETQNSNLLMFEDIKNDINNVLEYMFNVLNLNFTNKINEDLVKKNISHIDSEFLENDTEKFFMGKLPRGFNKTSEYIEIQDLLMNHGWINYNFKQLMREYIQIVEIKKGQSL